MNCTHNISTLRERETENDRGRERKGSQHTTHELHIGAADIKDSVRNEKGPSVSQRYAFFKV
jgi:hypothetical protein